MDRSKFYPDRRKPSKGVNAWEHSLFFERCLRNILCRDKPINFQDMLFDHAFCPSTGFKGYSAEMVSRMINNRAAIYTPEVDDAGMIVLPECPTVLNPSHLSLKVNSADLRSGGYLRDLAFLESTIVAGTKKELAKEGEVIASGSRPRMHMVTDGKLGGITMSFETKADPRARINDPHLKMRV